MDSELQNHRHAEHHNTHILQKTNEFCHDCLICKDKFKYHKSEFQYQTPQIQQQSPQVKIIENRKESFAERPGIIQNQFIPGMTQIITQPQVTETVRFIPPQNVTVSPVSIRAQSPPKQIQQQVFIPPVFKPPVVQPQIIQPQFIQRPTTIIQPPINQTSIIQRPPVHQTIVQQIPVQPTVQTTVIQPQMQTIIQRPPIQISQNIPGEQKIHYQQEVIISQDPTPQIQLEPFKPHDCGYNKEICGPCAICGLNQFNTRQRQFSGTYIGKVGYWHQSNENVPENHNQYQQNFNQNPISNNNQNYTNYANQANQF